MSAISASSVVPALGESVTSVQHWSSNVFSFRTTRPKALRFRSGEFVMIGLPGESGRPLLRAYSIASPVWADELEFYSIKVADGALTSRLQQISPGDQVIVKDRPTGTLVLDALLPGHRLWMVSTGTGIAPFASLARDPETFEKFGDVILTHTARTLDELAYGVALAEHLAANPLVGPEAAGKFRLYSTTTRETSPRMGRVTDLMTGGKLFGDLGVPPFDPETDRVMICGSMQFNADIRTILLNRGLREGSNNRPAHFVVEKAFVGDDGA